MDDIRAARRHAVDGADRRVRRPTSGRDRRISPAVLAAVLIAVCSLSGECRTRATLFEGRGITWSTGMSNASDAPLIPSARRNGDGSASSGRQEDGASEEWVTFRARVAEGLPDREPLPPGEIVADGIQASCCGRAIRGTTDRSGALGAGQPRKEGL